MHLASAQQQNRRAAGFNPQLMKNLDIVRWYYLPFHYFKALPIYAL
jgi:hypothetical protein